MKATYNKWQKSWYKWDGDLWERLEKVRENPDCTLRFMAFETLLWTSCEYCKKYFIKCFNFDDDDEGCIKCPLNKIHACNEKLTNYNFFLTDIMCKTWDDNNKEEFLIVQKKFLQALKNTKFKD